MTKTIQRRERSYTEQDVDAALRAYLFASGNRHKAAAVLAEQGIEVPAPTIYHWATRTKVDILERLRREVGPQIKAQMAEVHQGLASAAAEIEAKSIIKLNEKLDADEIEPKDLSAVMQRSAIATGIHSEKHLLYSGQPTHIVARDSTEILRELKAMGVENVVDAVVVTDEDDQQSVSSGLAVPADQPHSST